MWCGPGRPYIFSPRGFVGFHTLFLGAHTLAALDALAGTRVCMCVALLPTLPFQLSYCGWRDAM